MIIDYSRRTDPACKEGLELLESKIKRFGFPSLIHIWTKAPGKLFEIYGKIFEQLQKHNTILCGQITLNHYGKPLESVSKSSQDISRIVGTFGSKAIRLRFDPIIFGYTTLKHYKQTMELAQIYNISRVTVNFLETKYGRVWERLKECNIDYYEGTFCDKVRVLNKLREVTPPNIDIAVCAESAHLVQYVDGITKAACADPEWFKSLGLDITTIKGHNSRKSCGCYYSDDWGKYPGKGGYSCPHKCLYCYAKHC